MQQRHEADSPFQSLCFLPFQNRVSSLWFGRSVSVWSLQEWHLLLALAALPLSGSLRQLQPLGVAPLQPFGPAAAGHLVPAEERGVPEASGAAPAGEGPSGPVGGPVDEGRQRPVGLLPTDAASQTLLSARGSLRVFDRHVDQQPRSTGEHRAGADGAAEAFHRDFERRQDLHLHPAGVDQLIAAATRSPASPDGEAQRALLFTQLPSYRTTYLSLPFDSIVSD